MKWKTALATLLYGAVFHYAYAAFVNPIFEYAHFYYFEPTFAKLVLTYLMLAAPVMAWRDSTAPASYGATLVFALGYVPAQLIVLLTLERPYGEVLLAQLSLTASMAALFWTARAGRSASFAPARSEASLSAIVGTLTLAAIALLVANYHQHMRLVSFEDVYDLRLESGSDERSAFADYLISWLSYCFLPFYFARGILRRRIGDFAVGLGGSLLIYSATGSKAAILMAPIVYGLHLLIGRTGTNFLPRLIVVLTAALVLIIELLPDDGPLLWVKSIVLLRVLGTSGWNVATYFDYFATNGYTFYTHIGPINALAQAYPYGELALGQVIGLQYSGSIDANFNANFWASDGFAALGTLGVPIVTAAVSGVFYAINRLSARLPARFVVLWLSGFWLAMLNVPLTTAIVSGGGALTLALAALARRVPRRMPPRRASPRLHAAPSTVVGLGHSTNRSAS